jgi:hypothetical protein
MGISRGILLPVWEIFRHSGANDIGHTSAPGTSEIATPNCQVLIPKGTLLTGRELEIDFGYTKSGGAETYIPNFRLGPAGNLTDPQLSFGPTVAATTRTADAGVRYKIRTNTAIQRIGAAGGSVNEGNSATTVAPANVTISDVTTTDLYLTMTTTMGGATEWVTIQRLTVTVSG